MGAWTVLGIAPTADLVAIKKAYAARLKRTRPDDDAAAYQALRDAYEWAQQHARRAAAQESVLQAVAQLLDVDADADTGTDARIPLPVAAEPRDPPARPVPPPQSPLNSPQEMAAPDHISPGELAHSTLRYLRTAGPQALVAGWPILRGELDKLPLSERAEACNWFAQLVIDTPDMPLPYAKALSGYFGWETDFRAAQWLGPQRAEALRDQLVNLGQAPYVEEEVRRHYFEIEYYGKLVSVLAKWRLYLFAILAPSRIARLWGELEPGQRYALGVPKPPLHTLAEHAMEMGWFLRSLLVIVLAVVLVAGEEASMVIWPLRFMLAGVAVFWGMPLMRYAYRVFFVFKVYFHALAGPRWFVPGQQLPHGLVWSRVHTLATVGFACLLVATGQCAAGESGLWPAAWGNPFTGWWLALLMVLTLVGLFLPALPATIASPVFPAILLLCIVSTRALPWFAHLPITAFYVGGAWFMACCLAHTLYGDAIESAWYAFKETNFNRRAQGQPSGLRQLLGVALGVVRGTLALPYRLMVGCVVQSPRFVAAVIFLSFIALPSPYRVLQLPATLFAALFAEWLSRVVFHSSVVALVPEQQRPAWQGWLRLGWLMLWMLWLMVYWAHGPRLDALAGLPPSLSTEESASRLFVAAFCLPWLGDFLLRFATGDIRLVRLAGR